MNLYDISQEFRAFVDPETGEVIDMEAFEAYCQAQERAALIEDHANQIRECDATEKFLDEQIDKLRTRKNQIKCSRLWWKDKLAAVLGDDSYKSDSVSIFWRKNPMRVEPDAEFVDWAKEHGDEYLRYKEPEINRVALTAAVKAGAEIPHITVVEGEKSLIIK